MLLYTLLSITLTVSETLLATAFFSAKCRALLLISHKVAFALKILGARATLCDVNRRALHLAKKNAEANSVSELVQVIESNVYENITGIYDLIITNPPIRAGKEIVYSILDGARDYLKEDGELWMVIRKDQGAKSTMKHLEEIYECQVVEKSKGFYIITAKQS